MNENTKLIFICSPYRGRAKETVKRNIHRARKYCRLAAMRGDIPFAPHLLYTQFLDDGTESERNLGITMGLNMLAHCQEMWVFGVPTSGMAREIAVAKDLKIPIRWFDVKARPVQHE